MSKKDVVLQKKVVIARRNSERLSSSMSAKIAYYVIFNFVKTRMGKADFESVIRIAFSDVFGFYRRPTSAEMDLLLKNTRDLVERIGEKSGLDAGKEQGKETKMARPAKWFDGSLKSEAMKAGKDRGHNVWAIKGKTFSGRAGVIRYYVSDVTPDNWRLKAGESVQLAYDAEEKKKEKAVAKKRGE